MKTKRRESKEMRIAAVWGWGDRFEDVGKNCKKYVDKRWKEDMKECKIEIIAKERNEGISYWLDAYMSNSEYIERIAEDMFYVARFKGDTKVNFVTIYLLGSIVSNKIAWRKSIKEVEDKLGEFIKEVAKRFINDPKIESIARMKKVEFITDVCLRCELESKTANKVTIDATHSDFELLKDFKSLSGDLIEKGLAEHVLGYELHTSSIDNLEIVDIDEREEIAFVLLEPRSRSTDHGGDLGTCSELLSTF